MTNEYKQNVLHYLTGDLQNQTGQQELVIDRIIRNDNFLYTELGDYFDGIVRYTAFVGAKDNSQNSLDYSILCVYGTLTGESSVSTGIVILDNTYGVVQVITTWADGTKIGDINCMNVDSKGNYYAVEHTSSGYRIVELNNIVLKLASQNEYQASIINAYTLPNNWYWVDAIEKKSDGSKYFIIGERYDNQHIVGGEYNVSSNSWTFWQSSRTFGSISYWTSINKGYNVYWDNNGDLQFKICVYDNGLHVLSKSSTTNMNDNTIYVNSFTGSVDYAYFIFYSNEVGYLALTMEDTDNNESVYQIVKVDLTASTSETISMNSSSYTDTNKMYFFKNDDDIFYCTLITDVFNDIEVNFGMVNNTTLNVSLIGKITATDWRYVMCYPNIFKQYNKYKVYLQGQQAVFTVEFDWNSNNYNGAAYISQGSLVPAKANVERISGHVIREVFNRNLYNLTQYLNSYTATIQVPNQLLNNISLNYTNLISQNNNILVNKTINITKNKYEELNLNFINKFTITDDETGRDNLGGASDLIYNTINRVVGGELNKIRINYKDNTSVIRPITLNSSNTDNATYSFIVFIDKLIKNIEMISNDEYTTYQTIDGTNLELNKYYKINQRVRVE